MKYLAYPLMLIFCSASLSFADTAISYSIGAFSLGYLLRMQKATAAADWVYTNVANLGLKVNF